MSLKLDIYPDQIKYIPANVRARIRATTMFGAKYVDLIYPSNPSLKRLTAGTVIESETVGTEVNTVFQNLVGVLDQIDPAKLNGVLSALAEGLRGRGATIGQAITDANQVLLAINPRAETARSDWQAVRGFSDTYSAAAQDILRVLDAAGTTSTTVTNNSQALDSLLTGVIGLSRSGISLIGPNKDNLVNAVNLLESTTSLLMKYNPGLTCMLVGAKTALDTGYLDATGGADGKSLILDTALLLGADQYRYPREPARHRREGRPRRQTGLRIAARCRRELASAPTDHEYRLGNRTRHPSQSGYRIPWIRQLLPGHKAGTRASQHSLSGWPRTWADPVPRRAALWGTAVRGGRNPAVSRSATGATAGGATRPGAPTAGVRALRGPGAGPASTDSESATSRSGGAVPLTACIRHKQDERRQP